ncbi:Hypothetical protein UVM_LOCUS68 [uncultured virus]|nr:Hypothetical protein UVM_LOCUS68 [uncultured virus]
MSVEGRAEEGSGAGSRDSNGISKALVDLLLWKCEPASVKLLSFLDLFAVALLACCDKTLRQELTRSTWIGSFLRCGATGAVWPTKGTNPADRICAWNPQLRMLVRSQWLKRGANPLWWQADDCNPHLARLPAEVLKARHCLREQMIERRCLAVVPRENLPSIHRVSLPPSCRRTRGKRCSDELFAQHLRTWLLARTALQTEGRPPPDWVHLPNLWARYCKQTTRKKLRITAGDREAVLQLRSVRINLSPSVRSLRGVEIVAESIDATGVSPQLLGVVMQDGSIVWPGALSMEPQALLLWEKLCSLEGEPLLPVGRKSKRSDTAAQPKRQRVHSATPVSISVSS